MTFHPYRFTYACLLALVAGCGSANSPSLEGAGSAGQGADGGAGSSGGKPADASGTKADAAWDVRSDGPADGFMDGASAGPPPASLPAVPGRYLTSIATVGIGSCAGIPLTEVLATIRAAEPSFADIQAIYNPATATGDGSFIYPYARTDGGFDVVFKRGLGDCTAGCKENDYLYFSTDVSCRPVRVGHFYAAWGAGTCLTIEGAPMWTHPPPPDPLTICGQDNAPDALSGTYKLHAAGQRTPCTMDAYAAKGETLDEPVTLVVQQSAKDPSTGTVTFTGTGHALVDGVALPAHFQRRRFDAEQSTNDLSCPRGNSVTARYDFEGYQPGGIEVTELGNESCMPCKGSMSLSLTAP